jgi:hypothetical protein
VKVNDFLSVCSSHEISFHVQFQVHAHARYFIVYDVIGSQFTVSHEMVADCFSSSFIVVMFVISGVSITEIFLTFSWVSEAELFAANVSSEILMSPVDVRYKL